MYFKPTLTSPELSSIRTNDCDLHFKKLNVADSCFEMTFITLYIGKRLKHSHIAFGLFDVVSMLWLCFNDIDPDDFRLGE